ncbi:hypothetical protein [uncultured Rikenella sp.]|uniref:hypothetical protein n=2 Tax=uncultured Rikenella sp. TaxID=368003 RepID=UPI00272C3D72|nr:hypothetical protein [uncultured Rikenella sp.]
MKWGRGCLQNAPGYRRRDMGTPASVSGNGYSWASTVSDTDGMHLSFSMAWLDPCTANSRGYSFQLRCLSE